MEKHMPLHDHSPALCAPCNRPRPPQYLHLRRSLPHCHALVVSPADGPAASIR